MTRHLLKLVWNRKRSNALIILEIFFSFLVVFGVATFGLFFYVNSRRPLGFDWRPVWEVTMDMKGSSQGVLDDEQRAIFTRLQREARSLPQVEVVSASVTCPYGGSQWSTSRTVDGRDVGASVNHVGEDFDRLFGVKVVAGRWFRPGDDKLSYRPVVIDADLARDAFGGADPIGKRFGDPPKEPPKDPADVEPEERVIGVLSDFRKEGELGGVQNSLFYYEPLEGGWKSPPLYLLVRLAPGTTAAFEGDFVRRLQAVAPGWSFEPHPLANLRETYFRKTLAPLMLGGIVAFFLLLMVGLGLIGVLWQSVTRRTRELGLRRAIGASRDAVLRQIVLEQLLLATIGILLGVLVVGQLPLFGVATFVGTRVYAGGILGATVALYLLTLVCALYPSRLAGRLAPADALRYE